MRALNNYIVKQEKRYNNTKKFGDVDLIVNSDIGEADHIYVNKVGTVTSTPIHFPNTEIEIGDEVLVHHNVFRRFWDVHGKEKNSTSYFMDDYYFVYPDQVYAYKRNGTWTPLKGQTFIKPLLKEEQDWLDMEKYQRLTGEVQFDGEGYKKGDIVGFKPAGNVEFQIDGEIIYRVPSNKITVVYGKAEEITESP